MGQTLPQDRLKLPQVTLLAITSVNVEATIRALQACLAQVEFAACKLLTHARIEREIAGIEVVKIRRLASSKAYSLFVLSELADHIETSHCLISQWDGYILDAGRWSAQFLQYDYIGASWPQFSDGHDVGNGGFSLRSKRLLEACRDRDFRRSYPEDLAIGRLNRDWLERQGLRFADRHTADQFSAEDAGDIRTSFGYHGIWHMLHVLGAAGFWDIYQSLDDQTTARHNFSTLFKQVRKGPGGWARGFRFWWDHIRYAMHFRKK